MEYTLNYLLSDCKDTEIESGQARAVIDEEQISIMPRRGQAISVSFRDIDAIASGNYAIELNLHPNDKLILSKLGSQFDTFYRNMVTKRNETILRDLLMYETLRKGDFKAQVKYSGNDGVNFDQAKCELRLYETALVILPDNGDLIRIPYSLISSIKAENYNHIIESESSEILHINKMGRQYEPFTRDLNAALGNLDLNAQALLKELAPNQGPIILRKAASLLRDGRAAKKVDLDRINPELWSDMEKQLETAGIKTEYDFLLPLSSKNQIAVGLKRGLMGDLTGEYVWFLMPLCELDEFNGYPVGNAVAIEAASGEGGGKATYFFRITGRNEYRTLRTSNNLSPRIDQFIREINRCMLLINFRREPIYVTNEQLNEPRFEKYRFAVNKIPSLQLLRERFIGRVFHRSSNQWSEDVLDLLSFNMGTEDDSLKWTKNKKS